MENNKIVNIRAVGDIAPGDFSIRGLGVYSITKKYGCDYIFEEIKANLKGCDILIGNLECVLSQHSLADSNRHPGLAEIANTLHDIGFDVLSLSNNHAFDYGPAVLKETISYCEKAGIKVCGLRGQRKYYSQPVIITKNSTTVGILAYNWIGLENGSDIGEYIAVVDDGVVNYTWNRDKSKDIESRNIIKEKNKNVINDIKMLKMEVDIIVLMPHWGYEWIIYPPFGVVLEARTFIDSGVDLIVGSHPHVPQGVEKYNNGLIVYSLGNFLFDSSTKMFRYGMMLDTTASSKEIIDYKLSFIRRGYNHQPEPVSEKEVKENMLLVEESSNAITSSDAEHELDDELIYHEFERQYKNLKYRKIIFLFLNILKHPFLIKFLLKKIYNLFHLITMRLYGKKIRW